MFEWEVLIGALKYDFSLFSRFPGNAFVQIILAPAGRHVYRKQSKLIGGRDDDN
jgi:hypothetical protein